MPRNSKGWVAKLTTDDFSWGVAEKDRKDIRLQRRLGSYLCRTFLSYIFCFLISITYHDSVLFDHITFKSLCM